MRGKSPVPICKAFLICRRIMGEQLTLIGQENCHHTTTFPSAEPISFFARLTCFHGPCQLEVQLQDRNGSVAWHWEHPEFVMPSPLHTIEFKETIVPVFPASGSDSIVLVANGEELSREPFAARLRTAAINR